MNTALARTIQRQPLVAWGLAMLGLALALALFAPWLAPLPPAAPGAVIFAAPSADHWLGTDDAGADVLANLLHGARVSLAVGFGAALIAVLFGGVVGMTAGYVGGRWEAVLMRLTDVMLVIPDLPLAIVLVALIQPGVMNLIMAIAIVGWTSSARVIHAQTLALKRRAFLLRARASGLSGPRVLFHHLLPLLLPLFVVKGVVAVSLAILNESALSFLGLGDPTAPSWGQMLNFAFSRGALSAGAWWALVPPGFAIAWVVLGAAVLGHGLERRLNPRLEHHPLRRSPPLPAPANTRVEDTPALLAVRNLAIEYHMPVAKRILEGVNLTLQPGRILGVVGASGSGKSTLLLGILRLLPAEARIVAGSVWLKGREWLSMAESECKAWRWREIAYLPQGAQNGFNPVRTVGDQIVEAVRRAQPTLGAAACLHRIEELLALVGLEPALQYRYPHQLSGGMRQRAMLAMALACEPRLLLADEPTTALDMISQAHILALLKNISRRSGLAMIIVTHDLAVVDELCDAAVVLEDGSIMEPRDAR
ncbi:MAG: dipeptide/oligopeptide/nickel ABC transporter permease/ATP-binding protein [Gammaproteobacteria bacterium]